MPAAAPLITRWAKDVSAQSSRPDYPRPSSKRSQWKSLNGFWEFALESPEKYDRQILVPFPFESALSGLGLGKEVHERVAYKRKFTVPRAWAGELALVGDRKSTRLNSSHANISYAVFCLKKKKAQTCRSS